MHKYLVYLKPLKMMQHHYLLFTSAISIRMINKTCSTQWRSHFFVMTFSEMFRTLNNDVNIGLCFQKLLLEHGHTLTTAGSQMTGSHAAYSSR